MKTILSLLVVAYIAIGNVNAKDVDPKSPVGMSVVKHGSIVKLFYRGEQTGKVKVTIYNTKGEVVFTETMRELENFMRPYNFSSLPEGTYRIELIDAKGKRTQNIKYSLRPSMRPAYLSRLSKRENKYMLAVPNQGPDALTVKIFDERNTLLYHDTEIIHGDFAKVYNLNSIEGTHIFEVTDKNGKVNRLAKPAQR